jgi:hypothetical protein
MGNAHSPIGGARITMWRVFLAGSGAGKWSNSGSASGNASSSINVCLATSMLVFRAVPIGMEVLNERY